MRTDRIRAASGAILPTLAFTIVVTLHGSSVTAVVLAMLLTAGSATWELTAGKRSMRPLAGLAILAPTALVTLLSGSAANFFLPEILITALALVAVLALRFAGLPAAGVFVSLLTGSTMDWKHCRVRRRAYSAATIVLVAAAILALAAETPLYLSGPVAALGVAALAGRVVEGLSFVVAFRLYRRAMGDHTCAQQPGAETALGDHGRFFRKSR
jgi:hypothetical protein